MSEWWSWLLTAVGVTGLWLAGRRSLWGWAVGLGAQGLWAAYAVQSGQYGFLASSFAYGFVYATNLRKWWKNPTETPGKPEERERMSVWRIFTRYRSGSTGRTR